MRPLAALLVLLPLALGGCDERCELAPEHPSVAVELGTDADLLAVVESNNGGFQYLAVGEAGAVVAWGPGPSGAVEDLLVERFTVGDRTLRAVWVDRSVWSTEVWWVVGDGGTVGVGEDRGRSWTLSTIGDGSLDLLDIAGTHANRPIVVADGAVFVGRADGSWAAPPTPAGGWGSLRAVACDQWRCVAAGLGGVVWQTGDPRPDWTTSDPLGEWSPVEINAHVDLFDVEADYFEGSPSMILVGANGTLIVDDDGRWIPISTGVGGDLIGYHNDYVLGADGQLYELAARRLTPVERLPGARALRRFWGEGAATVGVGGHATQPPPRIWECE